MFFSRLSVNFCYFMIMCLQYREPYEKRKLLLVTGSNRLDFLIIHMKSVRHSSLYCPWWGKQYGLSSRRVFFCNLEWIQLHSIGTWHIGAAAEDLTHFISTVWWTKRVKELTEVSKRRCLLTPFALLTALITGKTVHILSVCNLTWWKQQTWSVWNYFSACKCLVCHKSPVTGVTLQHILQIWNIQLLPSHKWPKGCLVISQRMML